MTEVLVPDHVAWLGLRVGPLEDDGRAAVADHDAVFRECVRGLDDEAGRMHRSPARGRVLGELGQLLGILLDQDVETGSRLTRRRFQYLDELRHYTAQVTHQGHI